MGKSDAELRFLPAFPRQYFMLSVLITLFLALLSWIFLGSANWLICLVLSLILLALGNLAFPEFVEVRQGTLYYGKTPTVDLTKVKHLKFIKGKGWTLDDSIYFSGDKGMHLELRSKDEREARHDDKETGSKDRPEEVLFMMVGKLRSRRAGQFASDLKQMLNLPEQTEDSKTNHESDQDLSG